MTSYFSKALSLAICSVILYFNAVTSNASTFDDSEISHIGYPAWFQETPFNDMSDVLNKSLEANKKGLMILFTTEGCSYCDQFIRKSLGNTEIADTIQKNFESVGLEIFDDRELITPDGKSTTVAKFASNEGVQFSPTLLFYTGDGNRVLRLAGYQSPEKFSQVLNYITLEQYKSHTLSEFLKKHAKNPISKTVSANLRDNDLFERPPYILDRSRFSASSPLLVIFEEPGCEHCDVLHDKVLKDSNVTNTLKQFNVVRLNASDDTTMILTPSGKKMPASQWYKLTGFTQTPAYLFITENGKEALKTDALVLEQRMMNSLNYMLEKAYEKGWTYQRFARSKAFERFQKRNSQKQ